MIKINLGVSKKRDTPKSSILVGFSIVNHPFWGTPIFGNTHLFFEGNPSNLQYPLVFPSVYAGSMVWIWWKTSQVVWGRSSTLKRDLLLLFLLWKVIPKKRSRRISTFGLCLFGSVQPRGTTSGTVRQILCLNLRTITSLSERQP